MDTNTQVKNWLIGVPKKRGWMLDSAQDCMRCYTYKMKREGAYKLSYEKMSGKVGEE